MLLFKIVSPRVIFINKYLYEKIYFGDTKSGKKCLFLVNFCLKKYPYKKSLSPDTKISKKRYLCIKFCCIDNCSLFGETPNYTSKNKRRLHASMHLLYFHPFTWLNRYLHAIMESSADNFTLLCF